MDNRHDLTPGQWIACARIVGRMADWVDAAQRRLVLRGYRRDYDIIQRMIQVGLTLRALARAFDDCARRR